VTLLRIGPRSRRWLAEAEIRTLEDLASLGALEAWKRAKAAHPREVSLNLLYALQGLLMDCAWGELPPSVKEGLKKSAEGL
jgi:DNA transformation protein and related proteins